MSEGLLSAQKLSKSYVQADGDRLHILRDFSCELKKGEIVALVGPSGSGKSTLLHVLGGLDKANDGKLMIDGDDVFALSDSARTKIRRNDIGFIYQFHHLLPEFSALENVMLPQIINGISKAKAKDKAEELLEIMKLSDRLYHRPAKLSGGEQQRVAIARALANDPKILLADEPTGNLDPETSEIVFDLLINAVKETGLTALIATHNMDLAKRMDRVIEF